MKMINIDPVEYGKLISKVESLEKKIDKMESAIDELLALANKGRGGFWMGMLIASFIGAIISYVSRYMLGH
jgi:tetrahydromethanopterin S-methyltransferase subunit G